MPNTILIARENVEAYNAGDWQRLRAVLAPDVVYFEAGTQRQLNGADEMVDAYTAWKRAAPDGMGSITKAFASGQAVTLEVIWTGTQTGPLAGPKGVIAASGKKWTVPGAQVIIVKAGKIKQLRQYFDMMTLLEQISEAP